MIDLAGKTILVSKRHISDVGVESFDSFFGSVFSFNENRVIVHRENKEKVSLPYDEKMYIIAEPGFYVLEDGSMHENPDFISEWVEFESEEASIKYESMNAPNDE